MSDSTETWTVTADVIDGELVIGHDGEDRDLIILPDGTTEAAIFEVGSWGEDEESMDRADTALTSAGWKRVSEWRDAPNDARQATITRTS